MKLYNEQFLQSLDNDPNIGLYEICRHYLAAIRTVGNISLVEHLEAYALIETYVAANEMILVVPPLPNNRQDSINAIIQFISKIEQDLTPYIQSEEEQKLLQNFRSEFSAHIGKAFVYEFSSGDLERIQNLLSELRNLVSESRIFEEKHRRRLLNRLEKLQKELHKKQSDLDHFWGLVGDAGVALGKFGKDAKPFVDRIKEITDIVWRTQSRAEELPSDAKPALLESDEN